MRYALVIVLVCFAQVASAGPHQVLVLRSEGTADAASRTTIDSHVLRLAKNINGKVDAGDITFTEAAAVVGCNPADAGCKDEMLTTLGVDEVVATTVTASPTGLNVTVRRIGKTGPPKAAQTSVPTGRSPDANLNADIGPMFGLTAAPVVDDKTPPATTQPNPPPPPVTTTTPPPTVAQTDNSTAPISNNNVTAAPNGAVVPVDRPRRRTPKVLMGVGGGFVLLSILMWTQAADVQGQIDDKPEPQSPADIQALRDLEQKGDDIAGAGNLFFLVGLAAGGAGAYLYWKAGRSSNTQTARIAPTAFPGGGGVTLTLGGAP
ncbi:MAG TPA: hypothetical protein VIV11_13105 [Kofleriaceae bacterium]